MKRVTKKQVQKLVELNNILGRLSLSYENDVYTIKSSEGGQIQFTDSRTTDKVYRILTNELFFSKPSNFFDSDEFDGLCQASQNGENPYKCTIMY